MKSKPRRPVKGLALLLVLLMGVLAPGCMVSTGVHLWQFRNQMIDFDRNCRFVDARGERGPELQFLDPVLTREDIRSVANGRPGHPHRQGGARGALGLHLGPAPGHDQKTHQP
jgi:hypothetical protein